VCVCMYACMCVCIMRECVHVCMYVCVCVCVCVSVCVGRQAGRFDHNLNSSVFWVITRREVVRNRRFGATYRSHFRGSN
jgi:type IV secretory pathway VirB3-like protein